MIFVPKMKSLHFDMHDNKSMFLEDQLHHMRRKVRNLSASTTFNSFRGRSREERLLKEIKRLREALKGIKRCANMPDDLNNTPNMVRALSSEGTENKNIGGTSAKIEVASDHIESRKLERGRMEKDSKQTMRK
eukprot:CAMPEP_0185279340 /NCGR_PEP_ID=MMETSP1359-20130426/63328_1 /TAXON_ID=552665 /ORGANISM="Bigelowiella longifila, Strain CCMP242" /LENGTH=132 /DNA_ID=CAMNT_0027874199 /DNA_START=1 /DNA_END=399 /DNA_ORIENTATION=+